MQGQKYNKCKKTTVALIANQPKWSYSLHKKCPYSELFWSAFSHIRTEYGEILRISPYLVRMRGNADHNNPEYGHFSRSD